MMKAVVMNKQGNSNHTEVNTPQSTDHEVLIKVRKCGLCGSDINKIRSSQEYNLNNLIMGHEIVGEIVEDNNEFKKGEVVAINPLNTCKNCHSCIQGNFGLCDSLKITGRDTNGGFATYITVAKSNIFKINSDRYLNSATFADLLACCIRAYKHSTSPEKKKILIIGDGPTSLTLAKLLILNHNNVDIVGKHIYNLDIALKFGIKNTFLNSDDVKSNDYDVVYETVGRNQTQTINQAISAVKKNGTITIMGVFDKKFKADLNARELLYKEINLKGSNCHGITNNRLDFQEAMDMINSEQIDFNDLVTDELPLKNFQIGVDKMLSKDKTIKIIYNVS